MSLEPDDIDHAHRVGRWLWDNPGKLAGCAALAVTVLVWLLFHLA